jgi:hypothetical protein
MAVKNKQLALALAIFLSACGSVDNEHQVEAELKYNGPPVSWQAGDRIRAEGKLARTPDNSYVLEISTKTGSSIMSDCLLLRATERLGLLSRIKAMIFAGTGKLLTVTGKTNERFPTYSLREAGEHANRMCIAGIVAEELNAKW